MRSGVNSRPEAVVCWHVITDGGMLPVARRPLMRRNTLTFMINFDRAAV